MTDPAPLPPPAPSEDMSTRLINSGCRPGTSIAMKGQRGDNQNSHMSASGAGYARTYRGGKPVLTERGETTGLPVAIQMVGAM